MDMETIRTPATSTWASGKLSPTVSKATTRNTTAKRNHRVVYEHAKEALGMTMPKSALYSALIYGFLLLTKSALYSALM